MREKYFTSKIILIIGIVVFITLLHYITGMGQIYQHIFFRELYFLPLILAGFWFGLKGGMITSLSITVLYFPTLFLYWQGFSPDDFDKMLEILLFNIVAAGLGYLSDRRSSEAKKKIAAEHRAKEQAESVSRMKSDFLSIISHELRTPLISIIGYNDLLLDGVAGSLNVEQIDALEKIDRNSKRLLELITSMLDLSSLEAKSTELHEVNLSSLLEDLKSDTEDLYKKSTLNIVWKVEQGLSLITDPVKFKVILKHLISNAMKFTEQGSVMVEAHSLDKGIEIGVTDTGIGIPSEAQQLIFEPFRQLESLLTRQHGGVGLGLYIVKRFVKSLGGTIKVQSEVGRGSTFRVWIPYQTEHENFKAPK
jgi:signal transduction histidine kinase